MSGHGAVRGLMFSLLLSLSVLFFWDGSVYAENVKTEAEESTDTDGQITEIEDSMLEQVGVDDIEHFLKEQDYKNISFLELVTSLVKGGYGLNKDAVGEWIKNAVMGEFKENKTLLLQIIFISVAFGILKNFTQLFENAYVSELCFVLVYGILTILLMKSFLVMDSLTKDTIKTVVEFMQTLIPVYCMSMVFSNGTITAAGFYELAFLVIYLVQWLILYVLVPLVQVMVIFEFMNDLLEGDKFERMTELIEDGVRLVLKVITTAVVGLNLVQGLIQPVADKLKGNVVFKTASAIPGVGNSINAFGEIMIGTGTLVKNSVGVAAMLLLFVITLDRKSVV